MYKFQFGPGAEPRDRISAEQIGGFIEAENANQYPILPAILGALHTPKDAISVVTSVGGPHTALAATVMSPGHQQIWLTNLPKGAPPYINQLQGVTVVDNGLLTGDIPPVDLANPFEYILGGLRTGLIKGLRSGLEREIANRELNRNILRLMVTTANQRIPALTLGRSGNDHFIQISATTGNVAVARLFPVA